MTPSIAAPVAAGRDINASSFGYNTLAVGSVGVVAGRNFTGNSGSVHGDLVFGGALSLSNVGVVGGVARKGSPIDFASEKAGLSSLSTTLASMAANGTTTVSTDRTAIDFRGTDSAVDVFTIDGASLASTDVLRFSVPSSSTVVVNVTGPSAAFQTTGMQLGGLTPGHLLWNFPQATTLKIESSGFEGTLLAVGAAVTQKASSLDGVLIAASLTGTDSGLTWQPFNGVVLLGAVTLDKTSVCSGDSVLVQVATPPGATIIPSSILIDGKPGSIRSVKLGGVAGNRKIVVTAGAVSGYTEVREFNVQVVACAGRHFPDLAFSANAFHENVVDLRVLNGAELGATPSYSWNFGDGTTGTSNVPYVSHDYGPKLARDTDISTFQASVSVTPLGGQPQLGKRTATIPNFYAINKHQRKLMIPTAQQDARLVAQGSTLVGSYTLSNLENEAISLQSRYLEYQFCDTTLEAQRTVVDQLGVSLAALEKKSQTLVLASSTIPAGVCRVGVFLFGKSAGGVPASARSYFTLRNPQQRPLTDAAWLAVLKQVIDGHLVADPDHITQEDLVRLSYEGKITLPNAAPQFQSGGVIAFGLPDPGTLGASCRPGDAPAAGIQDLTCQAAFTQNGFPDLAGSLPQIRNALKGDAVLSVSCSFVGTMLRSLNPPQLFSHTGIMLQNNELLKDSTADEDRMVEALDSAASKGPFSPPLVGSTLKYGWPGAITETVSAAYLGDPLVDPDGTMRTLHTMNNVLKKCDGDRTVTGGRVLKAAPGSGDVGRAPLRAAANAALAVDSSYSFFGYTRSDQMAQQVGGADAPAWASNKIRTECSSFIWQSFNAAATGVEIEGQLEDNDLAFSGMFQTAVDGLYGYTSQQRKAAANTLFGQVYNIAQEKGGTPAKILADLGLDYPSAVANYVTNCFAFDDCTNPKPRWRDDSVGEGIAVSPDNMLLWDIYGANEPLQLDQMTATRQYRFAPSVGAANVSGHVVDAKGNPVALANVVIKAPDGSGGTLDTQTGADGSFQFDAVRAGTYVVDADKIVDTTDNKGFKDVTVVSGTPVTDLVIIIQPDARRRLFNVVGIMGELRDIDNAGDSSIGPVNIDYHLQVNPDVPSASAPFEQCVDNDVHLKVVFSAKLDALDLQTLHVCVTQGLRDAGLFENACNTDPSQSAPLCVDLAPGASTTFNDGGGFDSSNYKADYSVVVSNTAELAP